MHTKLIALLSSCVILAAPVPASAVSDYFLTFDGIPGGSVDETHKGAIDIHGFSWGLSMDYAFTSEGGMGSGKPLFSDFTWTQGSDIAVPNLFAHAAQGKHIPKATLDLVSMGGDKPFPYLTMTFSDVVLTMLRIDGASSSAPTVHGSFAYGQVALKVTPQNPDGSAGKAVTGTWDVVKGTGNLFTGSTLPLMQIADMSNPVSAPIPEPGIWAMLLAGLGMIGLVARRNAKSPLLH